MTYFDIHTHHDVADAFCLVGIHPWYLTEENVTAQLEWLSEAVRQPGVVAVGECGLDKLKGPSLDIQQDVFRLCAELSERMSLPLIIHAVKCTDELLRIRKELRPRMPWVIHGFRGRREVAEVLLKQGFYLSFGEKYREDALRAVPLERLFIETDESARSIESIYRGIAESLGIAVEELAEKMERNVRETFPLVPQNDTFSPLSFVTSIKCRNFVAQ